MSPPTLATSTLRAWNHRGGPPSTATPTRMGRCRKALRGVEDVGAGPDRVLELLGRVDERGVETHAGDHRARRRAAAEPDVDRVDRPVLPLQGDGGRLVARRGGSRGCAPAGCRCRRAAGRGGRRCRAARSPPRSRCRRRPRPGRGPRRPRRRSAPARCRGTRRWWPRRAARARPATVAQSARRSRAVARPADLAGVHDRDDLGAGHPADATAERRAAHVHARPRRHRVAGARMRR